MNNERDKTPCGHLLPPVPADCWPMASLLVYGHAVRPVSEIYSARDRQKTGQRDRQGENILPTVIACRAMKTRLKLTQRNIV